jgi:hypothetical protein
MKMKQTLPDRAALKTLYDCAVEDVNKSRGGILTTDFYAKTGEALFDAVYRALGDHISDTRIMRSVPAPAGAGKTSFAYAALTAITLYAEMDQQAAFGAVYVVHQIRAADKVYCDLVALLGKDNVAVWTSDHDRNCKEPRELTSPSARFTQDELRHYPVIVVTDAFYLDTNGHKAQSVWREGQCYRRALTIVDERPEEVATPDILLSEAVAMREALRESHPQYDEQINTLLKFMERFNYEDANKLFRPGREITSDEIAELRWFREDAAKRLIKGYKSETLSRLFSFASALAIGRGFINTTGSNPNFVGYVTKRVVDVTAGTVLLDATAAIDGIANIVDYQQPAETPQAYYGNLEIVHVKQHTKTRLRQYFDSPVNRRAYVKSMIEAIRGNMRPGQLGLVVCRKKLITERHVPTWASDDARWDNPENYMLGYNWDLDGRKLCVVHYGSCVGSNDWNDADCVFLMDEFFPPRRIATAKTQGLRNHNANEGDLGGMKTLNSHAYGIDTLIDGHASRWTVQMGLRGKARFYDAQGICGNQRLVISCDLKRFSANIHRLFPGAKINTSEDALDTAAMAPKLIEYLRTTEDSKVASKRLTGLLGRPWRTVSAKVLRQALCPIEEIGWRYVQGLGRAGSYFERASRPLEIPQEFLSKTTGLPSMDLSVTSGAL